MPGRSAGATARTNRSFPSRLLHRRRQAHISTDSAESGLRTDRSGGAGCEPLSAIRVSARDSRDFVSTFAAC